MVPFILSIRKPVAKSTEAPASTDRMPLKLCKHAVLRKIQQTTTWESSISANGDLQGKTHLDARIEYRKLEMGDTRLAECNAVVRSLIGLCRSLTVTLRRVLGQSNSAHLTTMAALDAVLDCESRRSRGIRAHSSRGWPRKVFAISGSKLDVGVAKMEVRCKCKRNRDFEFDSCKACEAIQLDRCVV